MDTTTFDRDIVGGQLPAAVDFSASWCGPCQSLAPEIEKIRSEYEGRAEVVKIDVDEHPELASRYGVQSVPTTVLFDKGSRVDDVVGNRPELIREALRKLTNRTATGDR